MNRMRSVLIGFIAFHLYCSSLYGQKIKDFHCATMELDSISRVKFPQRGQLIDFEDAVKKKIDEIQRIRKGGRSMSGIASIPIIVHVVHNGEAIGTGTNISQAQVQAQLDVLNEDYRKKPGTPGGSSTNPIAADIEIEFCLSPVGENGETLDEPGIHRYNGNRTDWSMDQIENQLKPTTIWDPNKFFNIWTVKFAATNASLLGYSQFPDQSGLSGLNASGGPATTDGVVIRYQSFGSALKGNFPVMVAPYNKGRTLSHETGHWLGLRHIWGDGGCDASDFVDDTPSAAGPSSGCQTGRISCGHVNMVENYMDYSDDACMNIFTQGQKVRMQAVIQISPRRKSLIEANLCSPSVAAVPTPDFTLDNPNCILLGSDVGFTDLSSNFPNEWHWVFEGGDPSTSTEKNPVVKYSTPGTYSVSLSTGNSLGLSETLTKAGLIVVTDQGICLSFNNFKNTYTPSTLKLSPIKNAKGYLTGTNGINTTAYSEFFDNNCGYIYISGLNVTFGKVFANSLDSKINFVVWNARGPQNAPGSVIERKFVYLEQIKDDIANNRSTSIVFDRETPIFGKPFQVGIEFTYEGDTVAIVSSADGEAVEATSWFKDSNETWNKFSNTYGVNIAMNIEPIVGMNPSTQISASTNLAGIGQEVVLQGRGASIFTWNSSSGDVNNFTGPQLIVHPEETTTYTITGSGLELCNKEASTKVYVSDKITGLEENLKSFSIYPNPGTNELTIEFSNQYVGEISISLLNSIGSPLLKYSEFKPEVHYSKKIKTGELSSGFYIVKLKTSKQELYQRWIKIN